MASKQAKQKSKTGTRSKKVKLSDLRPAKGGSVKGGMSSIKSSLYLK